MKKFAFIVACSLYLVFSPATVFSQRAPAKKAMVLNVELKNMVANAGNVIVGVYGPNNKFPAPGKQLKVYKFKTKGTEMVVSLRNLKFGTYALAIYQDVNGSGKINKNFIGIPNEPYAFSNNYRPTVKAPNFNDCKFEYSAAQKTIAVEMIR